uniref:Uncharacterized protein n=1 Tax=Timema genevievae TaxID=629358 RepID=A0A7R9JNS0_TIMGE|nr:unnamed protein product [Timema genevievae]
MINGALKDLGCEEVPSGCDLSIETTFVDPPEQQQPIQQQDDRSSLTLKKQQQRLVNMLRKPFRRKLSATSSPLLARCGGGTEEDGGGDVKEAGEEDKVCQGHGDGDLTLLTISDCDECRDNSNYSSCDNGCYLVEGERRGVASQPTKVSFRANKNRQITETIDGTSYRTARILTNIKLSDNRTCLSKASIRGMQSTKDGHKHYKFQCNTVSFIKNFIKKERGAHKLYLAGLE